jgi:hypothetical protein
MLELRTLSAEDVHAPMAGLTSVLIDCVEGGASVSFMSGISTRQACKFFENVSESLLRNERLLVAAFSDGVLVGCTSNYFDARESAAPCRSI